MNLRRPSARHRDRVAGKIGCTCQVGKRRDARTRDGRAKRLDDRASGMDPDPQIRSSPPQNRIRRGAQINDRTYTNA